MAEIKRKDSSSSSDDQQHKIYQTKAIPTQLPTYQPAVVYQPGIAQSGLVKGPNKIKSKNPQKMSPKKSQSSSSSSSSSSDSEHKVKVTYAQPQVMYQQQASTLPIGVTEEQVRRSLAGISLDIIKGEVRQEYIPMTRVETEYKEEVQYEQVPRKVKVTDYYQVEIQEERIPQVYQHTITEYIPYQKIVPIVQYKAMEKTYTRPEIQQGEVRVEQGQPEIISSQVIQTESRIQEVPYPQIQASGIQTISTGPIQTFKSQKVMKKTSSSYSSSSGGKKIHYAQKPKKVQGQFKQTSIKQMPIQMQTMAPVQTIGRSLTYAQPVQTVPQVGFQQTQYMQGGVPPQVMQPGMQMGNFQGVRLADSHILMK